MSTHTTRDLKKRLINYNRNLICSCGNEDLTVLANSYLFCKKCKKKYSVTHATILHNVRFGLLKAFKILIKDYNNSFNSKSTEIAKEFKITQKTAWNFLKRIRNNKEKVKDLIEFIDKPKIKRSRVHLKTEKDKEKLGSVFRKMLEENDKLRNNSN